MKPNRTVQSRRFFRLPGWYYVSSRILTGTVPLFAETHLILSLERKFRRIFVKTRESAMGDTEFYQYKLQCQKKSKC
jgi:hypothetical protein